MNHEPRYYNELPSFYRSIFKSIMTCCMNYIYHVRMIQIYRKRIQLMKNSIFHGQKCNHLSYHCNFFLRNHENLYIIHLIKLNINLKKQIRNY